MNIKLSQDEIFKKMSGKSHYFSGGSSQAHYCLANEETIKKYIENQKFN